MNEFESNIRPIAKDLMNHCQSQLGFKDPPELFFLHDTVNAKKTLGKTAHYDPQVRKITIYYKLCLFLYSLQILFFLFNKSFIT